MNQKIKQKGYALRIVVLILAVLLIGVGMYYSYTKQTNQSLPTASVSPDETANWKTYTNTKYGYIIKYPASLNPLESQPDSTNLKVLSLTYFSVTPEGPDVTNFLVRVIKANLGEAVQTMKDEFQNSSFIYKLVKEEKISSLLGYSGYRLEYTSAQPGVNTLVFYTKEPYSYVISADKSKIDQILSTFKFTDQTDETANWKTYTNKKYEYSMSYPSELSYDEYSNGDTRFYLTVDGKNNKTPTGLKDSFSILVRTGSSPENAALKELDQAYEEKVSFNNVSGVKMKPNDNFPFDYYLSPTEKNTPILRAYASIDYSTLTPSANNKAMDIFKKMVSTFKFTDQTANWKTYINTDDKFSLKYPQQFTLKVDHASAADMAYKNDGNSGLYQLWFYITEEGVEKYSGYSIDLYTSSNKTLAEQFPDKSLVPLSDNHGADEAAGVSFKSNEPGSRNENFTQQYFRVKDTFFVILPTLQDASTTDKIWNYPVLETLHFAN